MDRSDEGNTVFA